MVVHNDQTEDVDLEKHKRELMGERGHFAPLPPSCCRRLAGIATEAIRHTADYCATHSKLSRDMSALPN
jgi:hypothetical protein